MYGFFTLLCSGFSGNFYLATTMSRINLEYFLARRIAFNHGGQKNNVMIRIATLSVAIGMAVMIISLAVIFGFKHEITAKLTGFGAHVQIVNLDGNTSYETVPISINQPVVPLIEKSPDFGGIHPYAIKAGILRSDDAMQGVVLKGVAANYANSPPCCNSRWTIRSKCSLFRIRLVETDSVCVEFTTPNSMSWTK